MTSRTVFLRSLAQAVGLISFSLAVSGCFQTAGAQVQATMTPIGGAAIIPAATVIDQSVQLTNQAQTPLAAPPTAITLIAAAPTLTSTPAVAQLVFASPTGPATDTPVATLSPIPSDTSLPSLTSTPITFTPTFTPTVPTFTPSAVPTEPPVITPTSVVVTPTSYLTLVALQGTAAFNSIAGTQTQQAVFDQATSIVATATAGAIQQSTLVATLQGTGGPPQPTAAQNQVNPNGVVATFTPTLLPSINNGAVAGAMGNIDNNCRYTVVDGDRLFRIALRFGLSTNQVAYPNHVINPDLIVPDEVFVIPGCAGPGTGNTGVTAVPGSATGSTYMVVDGDTLYSIATRYGVRVMALAQTNGITNISLIYIGQVLTIPGR